MEKPEIDAYQQMLEVDCPEIRARLQLESGFPMSADMDPRLMAGSGENAAINRAIVGDE